MQCELVERAHIAGLHFLKSGTKYGSLGLSHKDRVGVFEEASYSAQACGAQRFVPYVLTFLNGRRF